MHYFEISKKLKQQMESSYSPVEYVYREIIAEEIAK